ncbi:translation initiation factor eIF-2B [Lederbergia sp. NSJ-179]|uniref:translation initiation factor eIF-2B n=1 Tax=Lederbergia sp. NSJ-179 TaxID=2931402 RepID=UPI001FD341BD|nr:translation initiation factor eIF-2B [Lederbergia sp. NSJ-179]MCJ7842967.1 translation initiation factor eIF-2B [Lederbergia sp. NSJ-179]
MIDLNCARQVLTAEYQEMFDDIVYQRVLGASKHINMIGQMIESIALHGVGKNRSTNEIVDDILTITQFFIETRGKASQAISNAIHIMIKGLEDVRGMDTKVAVHKILESKNNYMKEADAALNQVVIYSVETAKMMNQILVFDYSSTVDRFLKQLGTQKQLTILIPESRSIDGGYAFVKTCLDAGHKVKFFPDAAMMYFLKNCDAAFMGAETFFPNGTMFNTTGSDIVALICKEYKIPLYVLTPLIKVDIRSVYGYQKMLVENDLKDRLTTHWTPEEKEKTDFICPELLGVDSKYITAYITERGIIPANQVFNVSLNFYNEIKGEVSNG